jgi:hypothetical protein
MEGAIWSVGEELSLVRGLACVWWIDLCSPLGDSPAGLDVTLTLPAGLRALDPGRRPVFGVGPDAHRPSFESDGQQVILSFPGPLPAQNDRRPLTNPDDWCALHWPLVVVADTAEGDGQVVRMEWRAMGDHASREQMVVVHHDPGLEPPTGVRRTIELNFFPWFSQQEQEQLAAVLRRCAFSDISLNWFDHGIPLLPVEAYTHCARILRQTVPGLRIWINGMPGADTIAPRAQDHYGRPIPQVASPEALIHQCPDLVVASVRGWCHAVEADGCMVTLHEPAAVDTDHMPAHCFSPASRARFAEEAGLAVVPDALRILHHHAEAWVSFCCRQMQRVLALARLGIGDRPLAICALGPGGTARSEASADWQALGEVADILIYSHRSEDQPAPDRLHWGHTRVGSTPQQWWESWNDPLGAIDDPALAVPDARMQLALSGGTGVRFWSWACLDGKLQRALIEWR